MPLTKCCDCGHQISQRAKVCPSCGAPVIKKKSGCGCGCLTLVLSILLSILIVPIFFADRRDLQDLQSTPANAASGSAEVISSRLVPFKSDALKFPLQEVITTWKNTGMNPIRAIEAEFTFRDRNNRVISKVEYTLYAASDLEAGVAPGKTFTTPRRHGFKFINPEVKAETVEVRILSVSDRSGI
jgi:hypothetical protein